jgi:hypothetical protein
MVLPITLNLPNIALLHERYGLNTTSHFIHSILGEVGQEL